MSTYKPFFRCITSAQKDFLGAHLQNSLGVIQNQSLLLSWRYIPAKMKFLISFYLRVKSIVEKRPVTIC